MTGTGSLENVTASQFDWLPAEEKTVAGVAQTVVPMGPRSLLRTRAPMTALGVGIASDQLGTARGTSGTLRAFTIGARQFIPLPPSAVTGVGRDSRVHLTWAAASPAGAHEIRYRVQGGRWSDPMSTHSTRRSFVVSGLTNTVPYIFEVRQRTNGIWSAPSAPIIPRGVPGPPRNLHVVSSRVQAGSGEVTVAWRPPVADGSAPVTGYRVAYRPSKDPVYVTAGRTRRLTFTVTGLRTDAHYRIRVFPLSDSGTGHPSAVVSFVRVR